MKILKRYKIGIILVGFIGFILGIKVNSQKRDKKNVLAEKNKAQFVLVNQWLKLSREGKNIIGYFVDKGYKRIAVYGIGDIGESILAELEGSEVEVVYGIDKRAGGIGSKVDIFSMQDDLPKVDAVVVSEPFYFNDVEQALIKKLHCPVVSLEEVIYES